MKCQALQELISAYVDGELPRTQRDFVEEHLQHCRGCQLTLAEYTRISNQMSSLRSTPALPDIKEEIMSKTTTENVINKPRRWLRPVLIATPFVLALAIILPIVIPNLALTPEKVLAKAGAAILKVQSYRFTENSYTLDPITKEFSVQDYHSDAEFTGNSYRIQWGTGPTEKYLNESIVLDTKEYLLGWGTSHLTPEEIKEISPSAKLTQEQLGMLMKIEALPEESIDGVECYHYRGTVDIEKFIQKMQAIFSEEGLKINDTISQVFSAKKVTDEFWIGKDDYIIRQWKEVILPTKIADDSSSDMIRSTSDIRTYYDFNVPIEIKAPLDAQGNLLPGWTLVATDLFSPTDK